jgi:hypothetical protein
MDKLFSSMPGGEVLEYIRDSVTVTATKKRSFLEQSAAIGGSPVTREELAEAQALDAAAEIVQFALSTGQNAAAHGKAPPDWLMQLIAQARVTLVASED